MPIEILMPALSPTMTEGNLAKWLKKEGDKVAPGDIIAEIETDKATMEVEAVDEGVIAKIFVPEGAEAVPVNQLIAVLLEEGEDASALEKYAANTNQPSMPKSVQAASEETGKVVSSATPAIAESAPVSGGKIMASPLAKRIAAEKGVDLAHLQGTGPHGRIIKADVLEAKSATPKAAPTKAAPITLPTSLNQRHPEEWTKVPNSTMRKVIAKRLTESKQTVPHFYLNIECQLDALLKVRTEMNAATDKESPLYKLSVNDFVIKAVAMALRAVPAANASWTDEAILRYNNVDVSVAVAIDGGLITPIVRNADQKGMAHISNEMKDLIGRAKAGKLAPEEFQGGGFSISNLGMYGIKNFQAIVNPPQGCILAVGAGIEKPIVKNGQIQPATLMEVTLSCDHRVVDGAVGAEFLAAFKKYIEQPITMLV